MSRDNRRVNLAPGYLLHQRPWRDSSLIVDIFTREHGRLSCFARAARGARPRSRFIGLQPFQPLLLSWSGRGESPQLTAAEPDGAAPPLPADRLMSGFYLNELLLKLTVSHDPQPELYACYRQALGHLLGDASAEPCLRSFEKQLLEQLGYGIDLGACADDGEPVVPGGHYRLIAGQGVQACAADAGDAVAGHVLQALAADAPLAAADDLRQARTLMRRALDHCLEGRELATRRVARAVAHVTQISHAAQALPAGRAS